MKRRAWLVRQQWQDGEGRSVWWQRAWRRVQHWRQLARQRRQLAALSDAALKDIGLGRADIWTESQRPFWDDR